REGERMLEPVGEAEPDLARDGTQRYCDTALVNRKTVHTAFLTDLMARGLLDFTLGPLERVGIFCPWKNGRERQRLILDARRSNRHFRRPPSVGPITAEGLSGIELDLDARERPESELVGDLRECSSITVGIADVKDAAHPFRMPTFLRLYFCSPPARSGALGLAGEAVEGQLLTGNEQPWPCPVALPTGFSWSLFRCQVSGEEFARRWAWTPCRGIAGGHWCWAASKRAPFRHYLYVDNMGVLGTDGTMIERTLEGVTDAFTRRGLLVHEQAGGLGAPMTRWTPSVLFDAASARAAGLAERKREPSAAQQSGTPIDTQLVTASGWGAAQQSISSSTGATSEGAELAVACRKRAPRRRLRRQPAVSYVSEACELLNAEGSLLERLAVQETIHVGHQAGSKGLTDADVDESLARPAVQVFFLEGRACRGARPTAARRRAGPRLGQLGDRRTPWAGKAPEGWRRVAPAWSRRPKLGGPWAGLADEMVKRGEAHVAPSASLSASAYLCLSSLLALGPESCLATRGAHSFGSLLLLPAERAVAGEMGELGHLKMLDSPWPQFIGPLRRISGGQMPRKVVWEFSHWELPSRVKQRRRWIVDTSVGRYTTQAWPRHSWLR
ncbi:unnamed protein product, partial [Prorocentrum cordatum]